MSRNAGITVVVGARPNFVKAAPLWAALSRRVGDRACTLVHTGQHYDYEMSEVFFEQLHIPRPQHFLNIGSGSRAYQISEVLIRMERLLDELRPGLLLVIGDVNSTLASALAAAKMQIPIGHVESGLRSFDRTLPEEINRVLTDRLSTLLFATEPAAVSNLKNEGHDGSVHLVGNPMADALMHSLPRIRDHGTVRRLDLAPGAYVVSTLHRPANVDDRAALQQVLAILTAVSARREVVFPVHPRTRKSLERCGLLPAFGSLPALRMIEPLGYIDFMNLVASACCVVTDSGGLQAETTCLGIPCITLRERTEHELTLRGGTNMLCGMDVDRVGQALQEAERFDAASYTPPDLWDGRSCERIAEVVARYPEHTSPPVTRPTASRSPGS